jgi:uncharacterized protein (TIGR00369 family)
MNQRTHLKADSNLIGKPLVIIENEKAVVELQTVESMVVDNMGLIHGGFTFSLADYAAMLAVNDPNVVLGSCEARFIAPVKVGDLMRATAEVNMIDGRKREVNVNVTVDDKNVFTGKMKCYVLDRHVLNTS